MFFNAKFNSDKTKKLSSTLTKIQIRIQELESELAGLHSDENIIKAALEKSSEQDATDYYIACIHERLAD